MSRIENLGKYDGDLGMFVTKEPLPINYPKLVYLRYQVEQGCAEQQAAGQPSGNILMHALSLNLVREENGKVEIIVKETEQHTSVEENS